MKGSKKKGREPWKARAAGALFAAYKRSAREPDGHGRELSPEQILDLGFDLVKKLRELNGFERGLSYLEDIVAVMRMNPKMTRKELFEHADGLLKEVQERVAKSGFL